MSRDLSYPSLLVVLLTAKMPSILNHGGVSLGKERNTAKMKPEESISCRAQVKKTRIAKKEASEIAKKSYQDDIISDREGSHDDKSQDVN